ncbi:hypothetical protein FRB99_001882, partial [Tulasnella sp. 403]
MSVSVSSPPPQGAVCLAVILDTVPMWYMAESPSTSTVTSVEVYVTLHQSVARCSDDLDLPVDD